MNLAWWGRGMNDSTSKELPGTDCQSVLVAGPANQLLGRLESGWRPDLAELVAAIASLPPPEAATILRADQRQRWPRGERLPSETYLQRCPSLRADRDAAVDLI